MKKDNVNIIIDQWNKEIPNLNTTSMGVIGRLGRVLKYTERSLQKNYSSYNLNAGEFDVLATLKRSGEPYKLKPTELFNMLMITSGAMTNRIDTLEKKDLVRRVNDPLDRRAMFIELTENGHTLISEAIFKHIDLEDNLLSTLNSKEIEMLTGLLSKLLIAYEEDEVKK
ncbi:MarR family winged helix-turn-helix transcriptional regulator [Clostridium frigidicarnis]|uniref:DNA-binding transcriptional regulator, MarR family n=1 Tax=Clostridium frigidicarnis TaxID=84698 RepID=A0A1I0V8K0_9CLOT|nr:MarR family transcriptional regulator [Clostridium frigidicarnis]SFA72661.1 DNA-binding transcriptional regulator, MarR family [Clostridium frigidicarnis]